MQKFLLSFLLLVTLLFCFSQDQPNNNVSAVKKAWLAADKLYRQAELLTQRAGDDETFQAKADATYQQALDAFALLRPAVEKTGNDSLVFFTRLRTAYLEYYFDSTEGARTDYLSAIALKKKLAAVPDSFLFLPYLYTGAIYYGGAQFDSALYFYRQAEAIHDQYKESLNGSQRLYNRLGALYYETGDYRKARNYFEKAITLTSPGDKNLLANYKINIASILVKLEEYSEARSVYESLVPYNVFPDEIFHNLGIISLKQGDNKKAIGYFREVNYPDNKKNIDLYYNFAMAYAGLDEKDSSELYIQRALTENLRWNGHRKNIPYGLILKFQADELARLQRYSEAVPFYQQAVIQFDNDFKETGSTMNPEQFNAVFSYINLFNTLAAKADALEKQYQQEKKIELLKAALAAYESAFKLADYVERTYESDESRLFLGKIKYTVHGRPIDISLRLYELTRQKNYLEEAYLFDQRNKASVLSLNLQENDVKDQRGKVSEWQQQESSLKKANTRFSIKAAQLSDTNQLARISMAIRDNEIELGKLQEKINDDPANEQKRSLEQVPSVYELQKKLDNSTALLSYHLTESELLVLVITPTLFEYHSSVINKDFFATIETFKTSLHNVSPDQRYAGQDAATFLYKELISPIQAKLAQVKRLVIIPDDELNYLPFEALQDEKKEYLLQRFSIQYQYATALLGKTNRKTWPTGILSFAPFASKGYQDSTGYSLQPLPASKEEIAELAGTSFIDEAATKEHFLSAVNHFRTIHLATHASVNNAEPSRSFIAFYPGTADYKLYADEINDLRLDSTQLVILSACETGTGKLIKGEGLMSLSRAFAYAGCPNIITSLWKAEDQTTAYITQRLHYYLDKKYSTDKALQQAKLDLLNNNEIDPRFKSPQYWAHLVFIGNYEQRQSGSNWWWVGLTIIVGAVAYKLIKRKA